MPASKIGKSTLKLIRHLFAQQNYIVYAVILSKAESVLGWQRRTDFDSLVKMMVEADIARYSGNQGTDWTLQTK
jgi:GDP-D-mannose dehydratase